MIINNMNMNNLTTNFLGNTSNITFLAQGIFQQILPDQFAGKAATNLGNLKTGCGRAVAAFDIIKIIITLLVVFLIIAAIIYAIISGFKYVSAQGESSKVEEATESIKAVLLGVGAAFVGMVLVVIISNIFTTTSQNSILDSAANILGGNGNGGTYGGGTPANTQNPLLNKVVDSISGHCVAGGINSN